MKTEIKKISCISDTHGRHRDVRVPKCDVLIHAGDWSHTGEESIIVDIFQWFEEQPCDHVVAICGNHDLSVEASPNWFKREVLDKTSDKIHYLQADSLLFDACCTIDGIKFFGSPWTPSFHGWAFNFPPTRAKFCDTTKTSDWSNGHAVEHWNRIPNDTDVVITHGPPKGILDRLQHDGVNAGCEALRTAIREINPKLHIFGHIHEAYGGRVEDSTYFVNASQMTGNRKLNNKPVEVIYSSLIK